jgi:hypothetical protein
MTRHLRIVKIVVALAAACAAVVVPTAGASAAKKAPRCQRHGASLVAAQGSVRVVRVKEHPAANETRRERLLGCWAPTGRRFTLLVERDFGDDLQEHTDFEIVGGRFIGTVLDAQGGVSEDVNATVWDARTATKLHDSKPCDTLDRGDFGGVDDVVFLPGGGMAYTCNQLRIADAKGDRALEPPGTDVRNLAVSMNRRGFSPRLYWLVVNGPTQTPKSLDLAA